MANDKEKTKACCAKERERLAEHIAHCDSPTKSADERHHCYRFAAWQSGRRTRRCAAKS